jgi:O-acetyl-ADP-ribose deacetylase (regulator of RNase III)
MKTVKGNLISLALDGEFDVIVHGCNCQCVMGAGIAKVVRAAFPEAWKADQETVKGDKGKLGGFTAAGCPTPHGTVVVVNAYTQYDRRGPMPRTDYGALQRCFRKVKAAFSGKRIGYPKIGAGIGGGDWGVISTIIDKELEGEDHTYVEFDQ